MKGNVGEEKLSVPEDKAERAVGESESHKLLQYLSPSSTKVVRLDGNEESEVFPSADNAEYEGERPGAHVNLEEVEDELLRALKTEIRIATAKRPPEKTDDDDSLSGLGNLDDSSVFLTLNQDSYGDELNYSLKDDASASLKSASVRLNSSRPQRSYHEKNYRASSRTRKHLTSAVVDAMQALQKKLRQIRSERDSSIKRSARLASWLEIEKQRCKDSETTYKKLLKDLSNQHSKLLERHQKCEQELRQKNEALELRNATLKKSIEDAIGEKARFEEKVSRLEQKFDSAWDGSSRKVMGTELPKPRNDRDKYILDLETKILDLELTLDQIMTAMNLSSPRFDERHTDYSGDNVRLHKHHDSSMLHKAERKQRSVSKPSQREKEFRQRPSLHQRLVEANLGREIPFLLGTNPGDSFSIYANAQTSLANQTRGRSPTKNRLRARQYHVEGPDLKQHSTTTESPRSYERKIEALRALRRFRQSQN